MYLLWQAMMHAWVCSIYATAGCRITPAFAPMIRNTMHAECNRIALYFCCWQMGVYHVAALFTLSHGGWRTPLIRHGTLDGPHGIDFAKVPRSQYLLQNHSLGD